MKFALALGTARRLEHDEAEQVFVYTYPEGSIEPAGAATPARPGTSAGNTAGGGGRNNNGWSARPGTSAGTTGSDSNNGGRGSSALSAGNGSGRENDRRDEVQVYVREKVRIESADPSLLSLSAKLMALTNTLALARGNLAAVMGQDFDE